MVLLNKGKVLSGCFCLCGEVRGKCESNKIISHQMRCLLEASVIQLTHCLFSSPRCQTQFGGTSTKCSDPKQILCQLIRRSVKRLKRLDLLDSISQVKLIMKKGSFRGFVQTPTTSAQTNVKSIHLRFGGLRSHDIMGRPKILFFWHLKQIPSKCCQKKACVSSCFYLLPYSRPDWYLARRV